MDLDPFSQLEETIWAMLEHSTEVTEVVRVANRIKYNKEEPYKTEVRESDLPELILYPRSGRFNEPGSGVSSHSVTVRVRHSLLLTTGTLRLRRPRGDGLNQLRWDIFVAFERARRRITGAGIFGLDWLRTFDLSNYQDQEIEIAEAGERSVPKGWRSVLDLNATMVFSIAEIIA